MQRDREGLVETHRERLAVQRVRRWRLVAKREAFGRVVDALEDLDDQVERAAVLRAVLVALELRGEVKP